jgi:hypothetical protein
MVNDWNTIHLVGLFSLEDQRLLWGEIPLVYSEKDTTHLIFSVEEMTSF